MAVSGERDSISPNMPPPFHAPVDMEATSNPGNEEEIEASKWVEAMLRKVEKGDVDPYLGESFSLGQWACQAWTLREDEEVIHISCPASLLDSVDVLRWITNAMHYNWMVRMVIIT